MNNILSEEQQNCFAVIDTETNWYNQVMSIGIVAADGRTFDSIGRKYYIIAPEYEFGGMFSASLPLPDGRQTEICTREEAISDLLHFFSDRNITSVFAYNAYFDFSHLPELSCGFNWYDIMKCAAYRQYNYKINSNMDCCKTGRLKRNYGVEPILRLLTDDCSYYETHNALYDAEDELKIMKLLGLPLHAYKKINHT